PQHALARLRGVLAVRSQARGVGAIEAVGRSGSRAIRPAEVRVVPQIARRASLVLVEQSAQAPHRHAIGLYRGLAEVERAVLVRPAEGTHGELAHREREKSGGGTDHDRCRAEPIAAESGLAGAVRADRRLSLAE